MQTLQLLSSGVSAAMDVSSFNFYHKVTYNGTADRPLVLRLITYQQVSITHSQPDHVQPVTHKQ